MAEAFLGGGAILGGEDVFGGMSFDHVNSFRALIEYFLIIIIFS